MPRPWWAKLWPYGPLVRSDLGVERREQAADALDGAYYSAVIDATVSEYVMTQVKVIVDLKLASMRTLEGKAAQIVGFAGTVTAVVGVFGRNVPGPLLPGTVGFLLASIVCNLRGMAIRQDDVPSPSLYNISRVAENPVIKLESQWHSQRRIRTIRSICNTKLALKPVGSTRVLFSSSLA